MTRHGPAIERLRAAALDGPGELEPSLRRKAAAGGPLREPAQRYVDKVRLHAYRIVDADLEELRAAGWSEEDIFELTIAAALGAGLRRLEVPR
jgi:alkylhydroperoxidase family enzyme